MTNKRNGKREKSKMTKEEKAEKEKGEQPRVRGSEHNLRGRVQRKRASECNPESEGEYPTQELVSAM